MKHDEVLLLLINLKIIALRFNVEPRSNFARLDTRFPSRRTELHRRRTEMGDGYPCRQGTTGLACGSTPRPDLYRSCGGIRIQI